MEQSGIKEILNALELHSKNINQQINQLRVDFEKRFEQVDKRFEQVDKRFENVDKRFEQVDQRFEEMEKRFDRIDERLDRVDKKFDGMRVEITETQETVDFLSSKVIQHEKKLRTVHQQ